MVQLTTHSSDCLSQYGRDPAQILIRWSLQSGCVDSLNHQTRKLFWLRLSCRFVPLPKSATPSRIRSNADVYGFELDPEDMEQLNSLELGKEGGISWDPVDAP